VGQSFPHFPDGNMKIGEGVSPKRLSGSRHVATCGWSKDSSHITTHTQHTKWSQVWRNRKTDKTKSPSLAKISPYNCPTKMFWGLAVEHWVESAFFTCLCLSHLISFYLLWRRFSHNFPHYPIPVTKRISLASCHIVRETPIPIRVFPVRFRSKGVKWAQLHFTSATR
jgi:hypothetical protein